MPIKHRKERIMSDEQRVLKSPGADPAMEAAMGEARSTFRLFWREVAYDFNRIVPALELSCVASISRKSIR